MRPPSCRFRAGFNLHPRGLCYPPIVVPTDPDTILLTGATGQVGAALLTRLLRPKGDRVLALVRARDEGHLGARRAELLRLCGGAEAASRLLVLRGDVTEPALGLSDADRVRVATETTSIVHSAASVRFDLPLTAARKENVETVARLLDFAGDLHGRGRLRRFDHISTAYVAGDRLDRPREDEGNIGQGFRNTYEQSKLEAEDLVRAAMAEGLPATIHRPSIIVGDSVTGATRAFNVLYWPLKLYARGWWRLFPGSPQTRVDVVPVDWVADTLVALRNTPASVGRTIHLAAGDAAPTVGALEARVRAAVQGPPLRYVHAILYRRFIRPLLFPLRLTRRGRAIFQGGQHYLPYLAGNPLFDTSNLDQLLGPQGAAPSPLLYFDTILRFAVERDFRLTAP